MARLSEWIYLSANDEPRFTPLTYLRTLSIQMCSSRLDLYAGICFSVSTGACVFACLCVFAHMFSSERANVDNLSVLKCAGATYVGTLCLFGVETWHRYMHTYVHTQSQTC